MIGHTLSVVPCFRTLSTVGVLAAALVVAVPPTAAQAEAVCQPGTVCFFPQPNGKGASVKVKPDGRCHPITGLPGARSAINGTRSTVYAYVRQDCRGPAYQIDSFYGVPKLDPPARSVSTTAPTR